MAPATWKLNKIGPSKSPCLTPMMLPTVRGTPSTANLTLTVACRACKTLMRVGGTPSFAISGHSSSLGTRSKALMKSSKSSQHDCPCSFSFRSTKRTLKVPSLVPRPGRKPFCISCGNVSEMATSRTLRM